MKRYLFMLYLHMTTAIVDNPTRKKARTYILIFQLLKSALWKANLLIEKYSTLSIYFFHEKRCVLDSIDNYGTCYIRYVTT